LEIGVFEGAALAKVSLQLVGLRHPAKGSFTHERVRAVEFDNDPNAIQGTRGLPRLKSAETDRFPVLKLHEIDRLLSVHLLQGVPDRVTLANVMRCAAMNPMYAGRGIVFQREKLNARGGEPQSGVVEQIAIGYRIAVKDANAPTLAS
jgi:hypothetical protein